MDVFFNSQWVGKKGMKTKSYRITIWDEYRGIKRIIEEKIL